MLTRWTFARPFDVKPVHFPRHDPQVSPCTATYFCQSRLPGRGKSKQKRLPLSSGPACGGVPSLRRRSRGPV
ncbi:hypothetical protein AvCA_50430 [Azotobacter vinelandii CA]|uniref:Uncharacterized protein n=1 Tax=Azotobacter vinelandii (strain DJ / ATCC BAA-1303) TaxID=322710 RepID=C1DLD8_AZOVD|nr:hypothetical protein Avin_50430 [Azotobacter vinelandii DJ]AGK15781.1 hypothetical protein AvCA_50430 [Azotobacter vinelandii CA]